MTKFMKLTDYRIDGHARVSIDHATPTIAELTLTVGDQWLVFHMSRRQLETMRREIDVKLKATPLPARTG